MPSRSPPSKKGKTPLHTDDRKAQLPGFFVEKLKLKMNTPTLNSPAAPTGIADLPYFTREDVGSHQIRFRSCPGVRCSNSAVG